MRVQIDQSGRVEYTSHNTVLAFSDDEEYAILIPAKVKRQLQAIFRKQGQIRIFTFRIFAAGVVLLIKDYLRKIDVIVIDTEYTGRGRQISSMILEMLRKLRRQAPQIYFRQVGKKSKVHRLAHRTYQKKRRAEKVITLEEVKKIALN